MSPLDSYDDQCDSSTCRIQRQVHEMGTLLNIQRAITSDLEINHVLQLIADEARKLTSAKYGFLYVLDGSELYLAAISGAEPNDGLLGFRIPCERSMAGEAIRTGKPMFITNIRENDPRIFNQALRPFGEISCYLTVPLIYAGRSIGVIAVADSTAGSLGEDGLRILSMLAPSASIGIENARLYQDQRERRMEAESRHQMAESMRVMLEIVNSNKSLEEILNYIVTRVSTRLLGCQAMAILGVNPKDGTPFLQASHGLTCHQNDLSSLPGLSYAKRVIQTHAPITMPDAKEEFRAWLIVPLSVNDKNHGAIILYYSEPKTFSAEEINLGLMFSDEVALAITNARLRIEAEQAAIDAERNRLARELHDAVSQTLFSANLIAEVIPQLWEKNQEFARSQLEGLSLLIRGALAEMRTLLFELRPAVFEDVKLSDLLKHLTQAVSVQAQIHIDYVVEGTQSLPAEVQIALYRIAQEALNNVIKHSHAQNVIVRLRYLPENVKLFIADDGCGFDPSQAFPGHLGLNTMKERASGINAAIAVSSNSGCGTQIEVIWARPVTVENRPIRRPS